MLIDLSHLSFPSGHLFGDLLGHRRLLQGQLQEPQRVHHVEAVDVCRECGVLMGLMDVSGI